MTQSEWDSCTDPQAMLTFLRDSGKLSERKDRLFAVACCRRVWARLEDRRSQKVVQVSELYADGLATRRQLDRAWQRADDAAQDIHLSGGGDVEQSPSQAVACLGLDLNVTEAVELAAATFGAVARGDAYDLIWRTPGKDNDARWAEDDAVRQAATAEEERVQAALLRDTFGGPLRPLPPLAPSVLRWNGGTVKRLAEEVYQERLLPSGHLDPHRLAVLADALEEAGAEAELIAHLRGPGPHCRGCWAVDLLLGK
jgi:hypothetical protein